MTTAQQIAPQKIPIQSVELIPRWGCVTSSGELADSGIPAHENHVIGITDGKIEANLFGDVTVSGTLYFLGWNWNPGGPIYLNGTVLSQSPPGAGFVQQVGWALTPQSILVNVR